MGQGARRKGLRLEMVETCCCGATIQNKFSDPGPAAGSRLRETSAIAAQAVVTG